jgi:NAD+ diphosphatase
VSSYRRPPTLTTSFYAGQPPLNRLSFQRGQVERINEHLQAKDARFILFKWVVNSSSQLINRDFKPLVKKDQPGELLFLNRQDVSSLIADGFVAR